MARLYGAVNSLSTPATVDFDGFVTGLQYSKVVTGAAAAGTVDLGVPIGSIVCVQAFISASGAVATKALLAAGTDYTFSGTKITCVTDQSANKLVVTFTVA